MAICLVDPPENVRLTTNATRKECTGVVIHFTCTAEANPAVHTYLLYENDTVIMSMSISGTWIKTVENAGIFVFRCEANNSIQGIGKSNDAILTVDGEFDLVNLSAVLKPNFFSNSPKTNKKITMNNRAGSQKIAGKCGGDLRCRVGFTYWS